MKIIFFGSPAYSIPIIDQIKTLDYDLLGVVTQNDQKIRRRKILKTAVYSYAEKKGFKIFSPSESLNDDFINEIRKLNPDLIIIFAYGKILPLTYLELPKFGCINIHVSLLPRWRGASPIEHSILNGDVKTGISIIKMVKRLDAGPILSQIELKIDKKTITSKIKTFNTPPGRGEILKINKYTIINDSYNSNFESTKLGINNLSMMDWNGRKISILGDMLELGKNKIEFHNQIGKILVNKKIDVVFAYGKLSKNIILSRRI